MKIRLYSLLITMTASVALSAAVASASPIAQSVEYQVGNVTCEGWSVRPDKSSASRPGVLIVHQWTGLSDYEKMRAGMLAEMGYNVFVLDIYGKGIRPQPPESGKYAGKYKGDRTLYRQRLAAGLEMLRAMPGTDSNRIAAIGYCSGAGSLRSEDRRGRQLPRWPLYPNAGGCKKYHLSRACAPWSGRSSRSTGRGSGLSQGNGGRRSEIRASRLSRCSSCLHAKGSR